MFGFILGLLGILFIGHTVDAQDVSTSTPFRVVCYEEGWAQYRKDNVTRFVPEDVAADKCSHIIYMYEQIDTDTDTIIMPDSWNDPRMFARLNALKQTSPNLKVMIAVGGWGHSDAFTEMTRSNTSMTTFAMDATQFLRRHQLDGLDIDWTYPKPSDKPQFTQLLKTLRAEFDLDEQKTGRPRLILSALVHPNPWQIQQSYEMPDIANYLDFLNLMTYELHGPWEDNLVQHHSSLYSGSDNENDGIAYMINWVLQTKIPAGKLNMGLPFYGRALQLADPTQRHLGAPINGTAAGGELVGSNGYMEYSEVCKLLKEHNDTVVESGRVPGTNAPFVVDGMRWTGYDDATSIREKVDYALDHGLGGVSISSIDQDDFHGLCGGGAYPLLNAVANKIIARGSVLG